MVKIDFSHVNRRLTEIDRSETKTRDQDQQLHCGVTPTGQELLSQSIGPCFSLYLGPSEPDCRQTKTIMIYLGFGIEIYLSMKKSPGKTLRKMVKVWKFFLEVVSRDAAA